jgi:[calcium/calmodulin-dependent protein kinase] kinase
VDIWAMGICLYCLYVGHLPFEENSIVDLMGSIRDKEVEYPDGTNPKLKDLISRILEKNPDSRITMDEVRQHPWVTLNGDDPLLSVEENTANLVEPPTEDEMTGAITKSISQILAIVSISWLT